MAEDFITNIGTGMRVPPAPPAIQDGTAERPSYIEVRTSACHSGSDGDCFWDDCPQLRDGEPTATGRHCPLDEQPVEPWSPADPAIQDGTGEEGGDAG